MFLFLADFRRGNVQVLEPRQGDCGADLPVHRSADRHPFPAFRGAQNPPKRTARHVNSSRYSAKTIFRFELFLKFIFPGLTYFRKLNLLSRKYCTTAYVLLL